MSFHFGSVFSEEIASSRKRFSLQGNIRSHGDAPAPRVLFFVLLCFFGIGLLAVRLFYLSMVEGVHYRKLAQDNRIRETDIHGARGVIYDRSGEPLVRNIPLFTTSTGEVYFEKRPASYSGELIEEVAREYIYKDMLAHVLGYTGEITQPELKKFSEKSPGGARYKSGDIIGKMGIEAAYDQQLRGINGKELFEVDAHGGKVRTLGRVEPVEGLSLSTSLDRGMQTAAHDALANVKGAVVVTDPGTGEVLALYSSPSFDPNAFIRGSDLESVLTSADQPLFDRAVGGLYPPGSTFKLVIALAGLESGVISGGTTVEDTGVLKVGQYSFGNWYFLQHGGKDGIINVVGALKRSNDIYFYKVGESIGIEKLADWAKKTGVSKKTGIDVPGEAEGVMPDPAWMKRVKNEPWYLGNTYHVSIGQGDILTTPLQVNMFTNIIANGGNICTPRIVREKGTEQAACKDLTLKQDSLALIRQGMKEACAAGGTAWPLYNFRVRNEKLKIDGIDILEAKDATPSATAPWKQVVLACKTGTAEFGDPEDKTHAWLTVFAPAEKPQISVTVLVEAGGEGSTVAAPIAKKVLEAWFSP